ncbi:MAG TPA: hypothetical protein VFP95_06230 [Gammaproteobacteria bacterium]|nr:hypothetical protein [Gammaproteobacteria bacterium]
MRSLVFFAALCLTGCGTMPYTPTEYPLRADLISPMPVNGQTRILNGQPKTGPVIVYSYGGTKLSSDLHSITEVMVQQTRKEFSKAAQPGPGVPKTIELKVNSLLSEYAFFYWHSKLSFDAKLGNGEVVSMTVPHTSGVLLQDLNGCIAESVMKLLNDPRVRAYLAQ